MTVNVAFKFKYIEYSMKNIQILTKQLNIE